MNINKIADFLAAVDSENNIYFVMATPNLSAVKVGEVWKYHAPLSDIEIKNFKLITDLDLALKLVNEAKGALNIG